MTDPAGLPALPDAIRHLEGCSAEWVESVPVHETHEGRTVWEGDVQVFDLVKHPKGATRAYAWTRATEGTKRRFHVVLHLPLETIARSRHVSIFRESGPTCRHSERISDLGHDRNAAHSPDCFH